MLPSASRVMELPVMAAGAAVLWGNSQEAPVGSVPAAEPKAT